MFCQELENIFIVIVILDKKYQSKDGEAVGIKKNSQECILDWGFPDSWPFPDWHGARASHVPLADFGLCFWTVSVYVA